MNIEQLNSYIKYFLLKKVGNKNVSQLQWTVVLCPKEYKKLTLSIDKAYRTYPYFFDNFSLFKKIKFKLSKYFRKPIFTKYFNPSCGWIEIYKIYNKQEYFRPFIFVTDIDSKDSEYINII